MAHFFLECIGELRINILRRKRGVEPLSHTVWGLYHALTMDSCRLLKIDIRVGPDQKEHLNYPKVLGEEV